MRALIFHNPPLLVFVWRAVTKRMASAEGIVRLLMFDGKGFPFRDSFCAIGVASDEWMDDYFSDERFEGLNSYA
jgi:hypothetical protein